MTDQEASIAHWPIDRDLPSSIRSELANRLIRVDSEAFGTDMSEMWSHDGDALSGLAGLYLAEMDGRDIGFVTYRFWETSELGVIAYLDAGGVAEAYRRQRLGYRMAGRALLRALRMNEFRPLIVTCRTRHPGVLEGLYKYVGADYVYPFAGSSGNDSSLCEAACATAERLNPDREFDRDAGVIRGAYGDFGMKLYARAPRSDVPQIQEYFEKQLSERDGDGLVFAFKWGVATLSRALFPQRSLGDWLHRGESFVVLPWRLGDGGPDGVTVVEIADDGRLVQWADYE